MSEKELDFNIDRLGECKIANPIYLSTRLGDLIANYVSDEERVFYSIDAKSEDDVVTRRYKNCQTIEKAGPREKIFFDPKKVSVCIVTCGGLCPGINDVIRSLVMTLWYQYGVRNIIGIPFGYGGFLASSQEAPMALTPDVVTHIHEHGGSILGNSRGMANTSQIVDAIEQMNVNILFTIGGDGTHKGALAIYHEAKRRNRLLSVVGVPKTIDNDLSFIQRSFGFETAVSEAVKAVQAAHTEATSAFNGVGLVKVMGRESGFIATHTALASSDVNYVLIPEVHFELEGDNGLWEHLKARLKSRKHAVILVAEGAGQSLLEETYAQDASGNKVLADIGVYLKHRINELAARDNVKLDLKYIDPSYIIRGSKANPNDSIYCSRLGANAVHAAMAGRTGMLISMLHDKYVHIPIELSVSRRNVVDPEGGLWRDVVISTGQSPLMTNEG